MKDRRLPGTPLARLKEGFVLSGALVRLGIANAGMRSLNYAFERKHSRQLSRPFFLLVAMGYRMLKGVTTGKWNGPEQARPFSKLP